MVDMSKVACPGDPDLVFDVDGQTISHFSYFPETKELTVQMVGGWGWWIKQGIRFEKLPGDEESKIEEASICWSVPLMPDAVFGQYVNRIQRWKDRQIPVRVCVAPGKAGTMIVDRDDWLPFTLIGVGNGPEKQ